MAMEHFDEKIVPTFKVSPHSPAAAAAAVVNTCGHSAVSPSRILSGSFMSVSESNYLGVPGISSPVFGTAHSTPKGKLHPFSLSKGTLSRDMDQTDKNVVVMGSSATGSHLWEKINTNHKALDTAIKRQRRIIKKMQKVSVLFSDNSKLNKCMK